ncbi:unnamed protein product [Ectocarpus sp. 4 AP-2014]
MCQKWPMVTTADVDDKMKEHFSPDLFSPDLFSPLGIPYDHRLLRKLLHDCKVRYEREVEQQGANNGGVSRHHQQHSRRGSGAGFPTMLSDVSATGVHERSAKATPRAQ